MLVPDLLQPGLSVVFCGTALGRESYRQRAYYAHPGNRFWKMLHAAGFTPQQVKPENYASVTGWGIGLTDVCKVAYGNDCDIAMEHFDGPATVEKIRMAQPGFVAFTSKKAASVFLGKPTGKIPYGLQPERIGQTQLFVLTSPSGSGSMYWDEAPWHELAGLVNRKQKANAA